MAPEQLLGGDLDARTDLFAAGVVLYECLAGHPPFDATDPITVVARMLSDPLPPLRSIVPTVPAALEATIEKLLQREPIKRFQSARELAEHLEGIAPV
jgi:serine/threonine protein kinase